MEKYISPTAAGARFANVPKAGQPTTNDNLETKNKESVIQMEYGFLQDPHLAPGSPQQRPLTILTMLETTTKLSNAVLTARKGDTTRKNNKSKMDHYQRIRQQHTTNRFQSFNTTTW